MPPTATVATGSPPRRYSAVAIVLHWAIAALLFGEVALGLRMEGLHGPARFAVFQLHKSIGITVLLLVALRLVWRLVRTPPPVGAHGWERGLAHVVHALFYLLLFALPLSGWSIVSTSRIVVPTLLYGTIPLPHLPGLGGLAGASRDAWNAGSRFTHVNLVLVLYGLFALHLAGALKHHWLDRDGDLARMAPGVRPGRVADPRLLAIALGALGAAAAGWWSLPTAPHASAAPSPRVAAAPSPRVAAAPALPQPAATVPAAPPATPVTTPTPATPPATPPAAAPLTTPAQASAWAIQPGSTLHWRTTWSGQTIDGGFTRFDGTIVFAPDALEASHVALTIDTTSVFSGDPQRDETLQSADWFATDASRTATFTAAKFRRAGDGFVADGRLRLKGVTLPVPVTFTLTIAGDIATMHGMATIDRTAFKIGEGEFAATTEIPAAVALDIAVTAKRR